MPQPQASAIETAWSKKIAGWSFFRLHHAPVRGIVRVTVEVDFNCYVDHTV
jgi:hypothetical protein